MNHLVHPGLSKNQQMRWSLEGAHNLLQVRAELLNGTLIDAIESRVPDSGHPRGFGNASVPLVPSLTFHSRFESKTTSGGVLPSHPDHGSDACRW
jgi:hypothetical protein